MNESARKAGFVAAKIIAYPLCPIAFGVVVPICCAADLATNRECWDPTCKILIEWYFKPCAGFHSADEMLCWGELRRLGRPVG